MCASLKRLAALVIAALLVSTLPACGSGGGGGGLPPDPGDKVDGCASGGGPPVVIGGTVTYERLVLSLQGLGPATQVRPARHVDVEVRSASSGACYGRTATDGSGTYSLVVQPPVGDDIEVLVFSRTLEAPAHDIVVHNANPPFSPTHSETNVFQFSSAPQAPASAIVNLQVPYQVGSSNRPGIGFGMLDTLVTCWDELAAVGATPPERAHAYTRMGNNGVLGTSYYNHATRSIAILGGAAGLEDDSDTDYFDDSVVAHEFMHFIDKTMSHNMSRGGSHSGELLEPAFAWSEGMATGFACLLLRSPHYMDSSKTDENKANSIRFYTNAENATSFDPPGIGSEFGVSEVVWDCADGGMATLGDTDADGIDTPFVDLVNAMRSFDPQTDAPYLGLFLSRLVGASATISQADMGNFLSNGPEDQGVTFPPTGDDVWPKAISVGGASASGLVTSTVANPCRGLEASHWYQFTLPAAATVTITLDITPLAGTGDNLDLWLYANSVTELPVANSTNFGGTDESISAPLGAGTYILRVEASCLGSNRASYVLDIN